MWFPMVTMIHSVSDVVQQETAEIVWKSKSKNEIWVKFYSCQKSPRYIDGRLK